ncbi:MAG: SdrD B-like domain-containing protein, partial [Planctomycetaceae bacterium]
AEPEKLIRITPVNYEPVALGAAVLTSEEYSLRATNDTHFEAVDFMLSSGWPPATISGAVWNDIDGDGVRDSGEAGLADVTVYLDLNGDGLVNVGEPSQQTAADDPGTTDSDETGYYRFEGVAAGVYQVRQQLLPSHIATAPMGAPIELDQRYDSDFTYAGFQHHPTDDLRLSATGRYLVYSTLRAVLPVDTNTRRDIYLLDRSTNTHELISINNEGVAGNGHHFEPDVSADGRYVIYRSGSTNLDPADTNSNHDIYVRDRQLGTTSLLTKGPLGNDAGGYSADALITPDGQKVILYSLGANLIAGDTNGRYDTFLWDRTTGTFERISVDTSGEQLADNESYGGDVSADGRYVVFESRSAQLIAGDTNLENDIYWKDRVTGEIRLVSSSSDGTQGNHKSQKRSISDDGRWVVFDSLASNLTSDPHPEDGTTYHVYLKDMQTGETTRISKPQVAGTYNAGNNQRPEISGDGRFIVFESDGMLLPDDTNQRVDVYLYDRESGAMHLISRGDLGTAGDGYSNNAVISADGSTIAFTTSSTNLFGFNAVGGIVTVDTGLAVGWHRVSLLPGIESSDNDFGQRLVTSKITGTLWDDQNNNGMMDPGEPRLAGRTVYLDSNNDGVFNSGEPSRLTFADDPLTTNIDETGSYSFTGLLAGEYQVRQVLPSGWTQTAPLATDELARLAANGYSHGQNTAAYPFFDSAASDNGRFVAFTTTKSMLPVDTNSFSDLYVMERSTGDLEMISVSTSGLVANGASYNPSISGDGRFVAFRSFASNFSSIDANNTFDVFVRDRLLGTTTLISSKPPDPTAGELGGNSYSYSPTISRDGSVVTFWSNASNLVAGDSNAEFDLFLKNLQTGALQRINVDASGNQALGGPTHESLPSHDGRFVGYWSRAVNLVAGDTNGAADVFLLNRQTGVTERVSVTQSGVQGNASSDHFSMSDDARFFVFQSDATNFTSLSGLQGKQVYLKDRQTGELNLISTGYDGAAPTGASLYPAISGDGRWIVYHSSANNLVAGDTNGSVDVFLYDRTTAITTLLSRGTNGTPSNGPSDWVRMSRDGSTILFNSAATNLVNPQPDASGLYIYQTSSDDPFVRTISLGLEQTVADSNFGSRSMVDLGSAPESYGTSLESGGPHHMVDPEVRLGSTLTVDSETSEPAMESDNDGVNFNGPLIAGLSLTLDITTSTAGHLAAWIDFDHSGTFDADERSEFLVGATSSVTSISIAIPADAAIGNSYSRFRFSTDPNAIQLPTGLASDGEVEDYAVTIQAPTAPTDLALSSTSINENRDTSAADLFFAELSAVDGDLGDTHTYSLVSGPGDADNARFVVADDQLFIRQGETIDYETQSSYTIRVRVTDAAGLVYEKSLQLDVNNLVELSKDKILIGNGAAQRSRVETVSIEFDSEVVIQDGAFIVTKRGDGGGQVGVSYQFREGSGNRIVDLTFSGAFVEYGSLVDGNYELRVVASKVNGSEGHMDGDADGFAGGDLLFGDRMADRFFRLYGDSDGNGAVDLVDYFAFRSTYGLSSSQAGYNYSFDADDDGIIGLFDYFAFRDAYGRVRVF